MTIMPNQTDAASSSSSAGSSQRLFVGNLFPEVAAKDLEKLLEKFGPVRDVDIKSKKDIDGNVVSTFAFVNVAMGEDAVHRCIKQLHGLRWKRHEIRVQAAQESFMQRLQRERREKMEHFSTEPDPSYNPLKLIMQHASKGDEKKSEVESKSKKKNAAAEKSDLPFKSVRISGRDESVSGGDEAVAPVQNHQPDGKVVGGLVCFEDQEEPEHRPVNKRAYHSSSDDDDRAAKVVPLLPKLKQQKKQKVEVKNHDVKVQQPAKKPSLKESPKRVKKTPVPRQRFYSSSSDEEMADSKNVGQVKGNFLTKLKTFNSGFWKDSDEEDDGDVIHQQEERVKPQKKLKEDPNEKRLGSLKQRQKENLAKKQAVKVALSNVDNVKNKKITFDKSSDDANISQKHGIVKNPKEALFDDSDAGDGDDGADDFQIRSQFEGKGGEKLLALQSKFASDARFKIDSRFKEDLSSSEDNDESEQVEPHQMSLQEEREMSLKVLRGIVGDSVVPKRQRKLPFKDASSLRFDPLQANHSKFEVENKRDSSEDETEDDAPAVIKETPMPEVGTEKSYWMQKDTFSKQSEQQLKKAFSFSFDSGQESTGFSLLKKFGRDENYEAEDLEESGGKKKKQLSFLEKNPFKYDSSEEEEEEDVDQDRKKVVKQPSKIDEFGRQLAEKSGGLAQVSESFFFTDKDKRFEEINEFLNRAETLDELREKFNEQRPILAGIMKKKMRSKAKKMEKMDFGIKSKRKTQFKWNKKGSGAKYAKNKNQ